MSEYEGVDPVTGIPWVIQGGEKRYLACLPSPEEHPLCANWSAENDVLPPSEYQARDFAVYDEVIHDQDGTNGCVAFSFVTAFRLAWAMTGSPMLDFSAGWMYSLINGGQDQGANLYQSLAKGMNPGVCLTSDIPNTLFFQNRMTSAQKAQALTSAARFRIAKGYRCRSLPELFSAMTRGFVTCIGIPVDSNFMNERTDASGVVRRGGRIVGGHALCTPIMEKVNGVWTPGVKNTWSRWGQKGKRLIDPAYFDGETDHWALQVVQLDPQDANLPPKPWTENVA